MTDSEAGRRLIRDPPMALHRDQLVRGTWRSALEVRVKLIQRLATDAARAAVLEKQDGTVARLGNSRVERIDIGQMSKIGHRGTIILSDRSLM